MESEKNSVQNVSSFSLSKEERETVDRITAEILGGKATEQAEKMQSLNETQPEKIQVKSENKADETEKSLNTTTEIFEKTFVENHQVTLKNQKVEPEIYVPEKVQEKPENLKNNVKEIVEALAEQADEKNVEEDQDKKSFAEFFTTSAIELPKDIFDEPEEELPLWKRVFSSIKSLFARDAGEEIEDDASVFFPGDAVEDATETKNRKEYERDADQTLQFDLSLTQAEPTLSAKKAVNAVKLANTGKAEKTEPEHIFEFETQEQSLAEKVQEEQKPTGKVEFKAVQIKEELKPEATLEVNTEVAQNLEQESAFVFTLSSDENLNEKTYEIQQQTAQQVREQQAEEITAEQLEENACEFEEQCEDVEVEVKKEEIAYQAENTTGEIVFQNESEEVSKEQTAQKPFDPLTLEVSEDIKNNAVKKAADAVLRLFGDDENLQEGEENSPFTSSKDEQVEEDEPIENEARTAEEVAYEMQSLCGILNLRLVLTVVFTLGLFILGFVAQGILPVVGAISPQESPALFLWVNILLLAAAMLVSYPVIIEGVLGLWKAPSAETLPAVASIAALLQLFVFVINTKNFVEVFGEITLFAGVAGLLLATTTLGNRALAGAIRDNCNYLKNGIAKFSCERIKNKETKRELCEILRETDAEILTMRPTNNMANFLEQSFSDAKSLARTRLFAYGIIGAAVVVGFVAVFRGGGFDVFISAIAATICIGAPLSATLVFALPCVFMRISALPIGAVVPGWKSVEELGKIDAITVEAKELLPANCAKLYGIKALQKERVDLAILYATSILIEGCDMLSDLFSSMIEHKTEMLYPVKDLENRRGLGFVAWCENYRVLLGTRELMTQEGVALPAMDYEERYSKNGARQVLYLAVSGQLYAMFLIGYAGDRNVARVLKTLRKENIRLLVKCDDPSLSAQRIENIYKLPNGFVELLPERENALLEKLNAYSENSEGCMMHQGSFVSVVGALKAAAGADNARRSASAVQGLSIAFSGLLALFLALFGGLVGISLIGVLMYQIAWSGLCLGLIFAKRY